MRYAAIVFGLALLCPCAAIAQSLNDDVECLVLSNTFAQHGSSDELRKTSALTSAFYLGRVDGRASSENLTAALKAQREFAQPAAGKAMQACAARADAANARIVAISRLIGPKPK